MKLLFCLPHYYDETRYAKGRFQGSSGATARAGRLRAVAESVTSLRSTFGNRQFGLSHRRVEAHPANRSVAQVEVDVVLCTVGERHLVRDLPLPPGTFAWDRCECAPMMLGFECHRVMADRVGDYDWYGFLEDDLALTDPYFFHKLRWFIDIAGEDAVLVPNRFEAGAGGPGEKLYLDWDIRPELTRPYADRSDRTEIRAPFLDGEVVLRRPLNPHSGCFFVSDAQLRQWMSRPWFLDRDCGFIGPGESSATLGILRTFRLYKPGIENAGFLEAHHPGSAFRGLLGRKVKVVSDPTSRIE